MRAGILTFHGADNYGAVLQAYALNKVLARLGADPICVNYRPVSVESAFRWDWKRGGMTGRNLVNQMLAPKFRKFRDLHLPTTRMTYSSLEALQLNPPKLSVAFFGSDQIWNPGMFGGDFDPAYFGLFGSGDMKRFAYAASFGGVQSLDGTHSKHLAEWLGDFQGISVREESGADLVEQVTGSRPLVAIDPTLLIGDYEELIEPYRRTPKDFVFLFAMQYSETIRETAKRIGETMKLPIVMALSSPTGLRLIDRVGQAVLASPGQWLWLIKNAAVTVTNSFHGTVFSVLNRKKAVVVPLEGSMAHRNDRISNLLELAGVPNWMIKNLADEQNLRVNLSSEEIQWAQVESRLDPLRKRSVEFISESLAKAQ